jgi:hypothetical protein
MNAASVRKALERILANPGFDASARNRRFLEYIVEETLAGRADRLKGLTIAIDVFGRDASIDPQHDPVVRIEAAKLRRSLERYYLTSGQEDPIRIDIPKGAYVPAFEEREHPTLDSPASVGAPVAAVARPSASSGARRRWYWLTTALLAMPVLGGLGWLGTDLLASRLWSGSEDAATTLPRGPKIAVLPFLNLSGDPGQAYFAERSRRPGRDRSCAIQGIVRPVDRVHREVPKTVGRSSTAQTRARRRLSVGRQHST